MTRSTIKRLTKPLDEPEKEFQRCRKAALRSHQNETLAIAGRNIFDDEASSSYNTRAKPPTPPKTLHKILILTPLDDVSPPMNISSISELMQPTFKECLKRACNQISYLESPTREIGLKTPYLMCDYCRGSHEADECKQTSRAEQGETKKEGSEGAEPSIAQEPAPWPSILYQPSKSSNLPFSSKLKKQKKDDEDERFLSIFKPIYINLPFLEAMIHMPKGAKVLKDLLLHKDKLEKAASSVKLSEECFAIIQRSLPQKEGDPGSFTLPCLIKPLAVKNALADLGASINLMPHSLF
ncbi:hypothetical protein Tco_0761552 [Tanacetum coccineum]